LSVKAEFAGRGKRAGDSVYFRLCFQLSLLIKSSIQFNS